MAKNAQQLSIVTKKLTNKNGKTENVLPVGYGEKNIFRQGNTELHNFFGMAAGTEPAPPATERQQVFVMTFRAANTGKTLLQVTTKMKIINNLRYNPTQITIFIRKPIKYGVTDLCSS